jgi:ABC-type multidrug transport system ATPase subunit
MLEPTRGSVVVCGHCLRRDPLAARAHLGYVPDGLETLPELLVSEFLSLVETLKAHAARPRPVAIDERWRELWGVNATWGQRLTSLSFGQRKRVFVLAALTGQPDLLLLDEPTNGLDEQGVGLMRQLVDERRQAGLITVLSTNDVAFQNQVAGMTYRLHGTKLARVGPGSPVEGHAGARD